MRSKSFDVPSAVLAVVVVLTALLAGCGGGDGGSGGGGGSGLELDSGNIAPMGTFSHTFMTVGAFNYHCAILGHNMTGSVIVQAAAIGDQAVSIVSGGSHQGADAYFPNSVTVGIGETVVWTNNDEVAHTVTSP